MSLNNVMIQFPEDSVNSTSTPVIILDFSEQIIWINTAFKEHIGYSLSDLKKDPMSFILFEDRERFRSMIRHTILGIRFESYSIQVRCPDMSIKRINWDTMLINNEHDPMKNAVILFGVEDNRHKPRQSDEESAEEQYKALFENAAIGMIYINEDTMISLANKEFERLTGYSKSQIEGKISWEGLISDKKTLDQMKKYHRLRRIDPVLAPEAYDTKIMTINGDIRDVMVRVTMIPGTSYSLMSILDMTEKRHAENALRESEEKFRTLVENIQQDTLYRCDLAGNLTFVSPSGKRLLGYDSIAEMIGLNISQDIYLNPDDRKIILDELNKYGKVSNFEVTLKRKDGSPVFISTNSHLHYDRNGNIIGVEGIFSDITERKRAEEALERRIIALTRPIDDTAGIAFDELFNLADIQRLQDEFARATGVASIITNTDGIPITVPSNFSHLCSNIIRKTEKGLVYCSKSDAILGCLSTKGPTIQPCLSSGLLHTGATISIGGRHIASWLIGQVRDETQPEEKIREYAMEIGADEEEFIDAFNKIPAMSAEQFYRVSQALFTLANQLSTLAYQNIQQARFIAERRQAEEMSLQSEEKFSKIFMMTPDFITITKMNGYIIDVNRGFEDITGWKREEVISRSVFEIGLWNDLSERSYMVDRLMAGDDVINHEFILKCKDGSLRTGIYSARSIQIENESCIIFVMQDITNRIRMEESRRKLEEQLSHSQRLDAIGQLAGGVAHDINNILMGIQGCVSLMVMECGPDGPYHQRLDHIEEHVKRGSKLTSQLLGFARGGKYEVKTLLLNDLIQKCAMLFLETRKEIQAEFQMADNIFPVEADAGQIEQTLMNIFINAGHAMPRGGHLHIQTANVTLHETDAVAFDINRGDYVKISIADTGIGMDKKTLNRIFEPFFTTRSKQGGTGLGLASSYGIIRNHGGAINVHSVPGQGATFNIFLPSSSKGIEKDLKDPKKDILRGIGNILLVDDEALILDTASDMLEMLGYTVYRAVSGQEAIATYRANKDRIDLVILDMVMPGMSGSQILNMFMEIHPPVKIILSSGYGLQGEVQKVMEMGCSGFIQKPYSFVDLSNIVYKILYPSEQTGIKEG